MWCNLLVIHPIIEKEMSFEVPERWVWYKLEDIASWGGLETLSMNIKVPNYHRYIKILHLLFFYNNKNSRFAFNVNYLIMKNSENLNRFKTVLIDAGQTNKWFVEQLGKDIVTISSE